MIRTALDDRTLDSTLGRASPLLKLAVAIGWLGGLVLVIDGRPPLALTAIALLAGPTLGRVSPRRMLFGLLPLWSAALGIAFFNTVFASANANASLPAILALGPWRVTRPALDGGLALGARILAIASAGILFGQTTDPTRLADALVQQGHVSPRFAYGALAAFQAVPRLLEDVVALQQARRVRGLARSWHPRILVGLLVQAIRHGDRLALAMDARAFDAGPRSTFRPIRWGLADLVVAGGGIAALGLALATTRL
jgi:energy-coupling factor transport system permease protein